VMRSVDGVLKREKSRSSSATVLKKRLGAAAAVALALLVVCAVAWTFAPQLRQQFERLAWSGDSEKQASSSPNARSASARSDPSARVDPPPVAPTRASPRNPAPDRRVALVIGNSAYQAVASLPSTGNDASAV